MASWELPTAMFLFAAFGEAAVLVGDRMVSIRFPL